MVALKVVEGSLFLCIVASFELSTSFYFKNFIQRGQSQQGSKLKPLEASRFRFLESNTWDVTVNNVNIFIDPVMSQLDFGIPLLYSGNKRIVNGTSEIDAVASKADLILISQGYDDHAHTPTLKRLAKSYPNLKYICPPSAKPILQSSGIQESCISVIKPGETKQFTNAKKNSIELTATSGALLGPPWQEKENGYLIRPYSPHKSSSGNNIVISKKDKYDPSKYEVYYEPHCMFDEQELSQYSADVIITPVVSLELPAFTLVSGGEKAVRLSKILKAKYIVPMANGNLVESGLLSAIIKRGGSEGEFNGLLERSGAQAKLISAPAGVDRMFLL